MNNLEEEILNGSSSLSFLAKPKFVTRSSSAKPKEDTEAPKTVPFERKSKPIPPRPVISATQYSFPSFLF